MQNYLKFHLTKAQRHRGMKINLIIFILLFIPFAVLSAQEGFGFGESDGFGFSGGGTSGFSVKIGGEATAELTGFFDDFTSSKKTGDAKLGDIFSGNLNFEAGGSAAQAIINLNITPVFDGSSPIEIDEAFLRAFFGPVTVEGGIRKITWGKADSFGPLDVINPLDYSDLTRLGDPQSVKIARPMVRSSWALGSFTKLEAVFVPWFKGHQFDTEGRWAPGQIKGLMPSLSAGFKSAIDDNPVLEFLNPNILSDIAKWEYNFNIDNYYKNYRTTLDHAQAGLRFTTSVGSSDLGIQYYFGRLTRPVVSINMQGFINDFVSSNPFSDPGNNNINVNYNPYHQIA